VVPRRRLRLHHTRQATQWLRAGEARQDNDPVFCARTGTELAAGNIRRTFRTITKAAGIGENWTPRERGLDREGLPTPAQARGLQWCRRHERHLRYEDAWLPFWLSP
jgi:hypothetical protein